MDTKAGTLESSILGVWQEAAKKQEKLDPVGKEDGDIDNDGEIRMPLTNILQKDARLLQRQ